MSFTMLLVKSGWINRDSDEHQNNDTERLKKSKYKRVAQPQRGLSSSLYSSGGLHRETSHSFPQVRRR